MKLDTSFIRIGADWSVEHALGVLGAFIRVKTVVVHRVEGARDYFYAYDYAELRARLDGKRGRLVDVLDLHEYQSTPAVPVDGEEPSGPAVALDRGRIAGVIRPREHGAEPGDPGKTTPSRPTRGPSNGDDEPLRGDNHGAEPPDDDPRSASKRILAASTSQTVERGTEQALLVKLMKESSDGASGGPAIDAAPGETIDVVVEVSSALELVGDNEGRFAVNDADEDVLQFKIKGRELGDGRVTVYAFKAGKSVGKVSITTRVVDGAPAVKTIERRAEIRAVDTPPDLAVEIYEDKTSHEYTIRLTTGDAALGLNHAKFTIKLGGDIDAFFTTFYGDIEQILSSTDAASDKISKLGQKGVYLFERIVPTDMRTRLWDLRDKIKSVQIQSEEPWVPWELCRLAGKDDTGRIVNGPFISEQYAVTRWFLGMPQFTKLSLSSIGLVVPPSNLRAAPAERQAMTGLATDARKVTEIRAAASELRTQLASGSYDALHFVGHGAYAPGNADRSSIKLEDDQRFLPEDLAGEVANLGIKRPLVFLNACEVGRSGTALGGLAGWPQGFVNAGAGAFIGPFWKVGDGSSAQFAKEFYAKLLGGSTVGQAVHHARTEIRKASDPTWLAYVAYAHPDAKIA